MRTHRPGGSPFAHGLRAGLFALAMICIGALPLFGQAAGSDDGPLPTALAQANPFGPSSITLSITAPPTISIETPAPGAEAHRSPAPEGSAAAAPARPPAAPASATVTPGQAAGPSSGAGASGSGAADSEMVGYASWYGTKFQGRLTANGEIYDMYQLTAANRTLPFGTLVRVTNLDSGKSVVVRINDRGPFVAGRIIDLSKAAAEIIAMPGIAKVRLELVGTATAVDFAPMQREELAAAHLAAPGEVGPAVAQSSRGAAAASNEPAGPQLPAQHRARVALAATATVVHVGSGGSGPAASAPLGEESAVAAAPPTAARGSGPIAAATQSNQETSGAQGGRNEASPQPARQTSGPPAAADLQPAREAGKASESSPSPRFPSRLTLQVGAFRDAGNAARLERLLVANGFAPRTERAGELTRVLIPQVRTSDLAPAKKRLASLGITTVFVRTE